MVTWFDIQSSKKDDQTIIITTFPFYLKINEGPRNFWYNNHCNL